MTNGQNNPAQEFTVPEGYSLVITPTAANVVVCDVCGTENDATRELCRVCSNYLKEEVIEE